MLLRLVKESKAKKKKKKVQVAKLVPKLFMIHYTIYQMLLEFSYVYS